jgi:hypothetical protein
MVGRRGAHGVHRRVADGSLAVMVVGVVCVGLGAAQMLLEHRARR